MIILPVVQDMLYTMNTSPSVVFLIVPLWSLARLSWIRRAKQTWRELPPCFRMCIYQPKWCLGLSYSSIVQWWWGPVAAQIPAAMGWDKVFSFVSFISNTQERSPIRRQTTQSNGHAFKFTKYIAYSLSSLLVSWLWSWYVMIIVPMNSISIYKCKCPSSVVG